MTSYPVAQMLLDQSAEGYKFVIWRGVENFFKFLSNDYTNPNTNPKTLTEGILTLNDRHEAFESFCAPVFCDFMRNYSGSDVIALVTSY